VEAAEFFLELREQVEQAVVEMLELMRGLLRHLEEQTQVAVVVLAHGLEQTKAVRLAALA
jgi:hypothetical protein